MIPTKLVSDVVVHILSGEGQAIRTIEAARRRACRGDGSQEEYRNRKVWHTRQDLLKRAAEMLKIHDSMHGPGRTSNDFYNMVDAEIAKLRRSGAIASWNAAAHLGIFRLMRRPDGHTMSPSMSTGMRLPEPTDPKADMMTTFMSILRQGSKNNTYKFALARALLEYCRETSSGAGSAHEIPYSYFAEKFLRYYWYQVCKYRIKQDFHAVKKPKAVRIVEEAFPDGGPGEFRMLDGDAIASAKRRILGSVFGHARSKTSLVVPRFQNVRRGGAVVENRMFYDYDDDAKVLRLKKGAFDFLKANSFVLASAVTLEWAKFLERINNSLPRLVSKIERDEMERGSLLKYRRLYMRHTDCCFYCGNRLERGHTDVDHFIPWSYIFEDDAWNLVLACSDCNCKKSNSLAQEDFRDELIVRNKRYQDRINRLKHSLILLDAGKGWDVEIVNHYKNCIDYGFGTIRLP